MWKKNIYFLSFFSSFFAIETVFLFNCLLLPRFTYISFTKIEKIWRIKYYSILVEEKRRKKKKNTIFMLNWRWTHLNMFSNCIIHRKDLKSNYFYVSCCIFFFLCNTPFHVQFSVSFVQTIYPLSMWSFSFQFIVQFSNER